MYNEVVISRFLSDSEVDTSKVKYVLYIRKSTDDPTRQTKSVEDQQIECRRLAGELKLKVVDTIIEKKSAKLPNKRPLFTQMLKDIRKGKYNGILAWNPDRLARNMMEGGMIIDMIDQGILMDLKFVTHHFSNDANGKMLLGMAFVLSKQYSDKLSQDVKRGVRSNFFQGKTPAYKYGYIRDKKGFLIPDGKQFEIIKEAWRMRLEGKSYDDILEFVNKAGYIRKYKNGRKEIGIKHKQRLTKIFKDPVYYGVLVQANQEVHLPSVDHNFQPMITKEEFIKVQLMGRGKKQPYKRRFKRFYPFRKMILCSYCNNVMSPGASKGSKGDYYLYYRCDTEGCSRPKKSIRAYVILDFLEDFLKTKFKFSKRDYDELSKQFVKLTDQIKTEIRQELHSKEAILRHNKSKLKQLTLNYATKLENLNQSAKKVIDQEINDLAMDNEKLTKEVEKLKERLRRSDEDLMAYDQFLNLTKNAYTAVKYGDATIKDQIVKLIFLNLKVNEEKVLEYQLKEPFATLLQSRFVRNGRGERTRTSDLTLPKRAL